MDYIWIGWLKVNGVESAASVSVGPKVIFGLRGHVKNAQGNGSIAGDFGHMPSVVGGLNDPDLVDTPAWYYAGVPR